MPDALPTLAETPRQAARRQADVAIARLAHNRGPHSLVLVKTLSRMATDYTRAGHLVDARDLLHRALERAQAPLRATFDAADAGLPVVLSDAERARWDVVLELLHQRAALSRSADESAELLQQVCRYGHAAGSSSPVVQAAARALRDRTRGQGSADL